VANVKLILKISEGETKTNNVEQGFKKKKKKELERNKSLLRRRMVENKN